MKPIMILIAFISILPLRAQMLWEERFEQPDAFSESQYAHFKNGVYHIFGKNGRVTTSNKLIIDDAAIRIKTDFISGEENQGYGLIFRAKDFDNFYIFVISANGHYYLRKKINKEYYNIIDWTSSQEINKNGVNYLAVSCNGPKIELYINGKQINRAADPSLTSGKIGLIAFSGVHAHFDDLLVARNLSDMIERYDFTPEPPDYTGDFPEDPAYLLTDNFDNMSSGWGQSDNVYYERGYYTMWNQEDMHYTWHHFSQKNYILETNFQIKRRFPEVFPDKTGIFFRAEKTTDFYSLSVSKNKSVLLEKRINSFNKILHEQKLESLDFNNMIRMKVSVHDDEIQCWVNDEWLGKFSDPINTLEYFNFGFFASKGVQLQVYGIRLGDIKIDWGEALAGFFSSRGFISITVIILLFVLIRIGVKSRLKKIRIAGILQKTMRKYIEDKRGSFSITNVMNDFHLDIKTAKQIMDEACARYQGHHLISQDGNDWYDFPDYFRSGSKD